MLDAVYVLCFNAEFINHLSEVHASFNAAFCLATSVIAVKYKSFLQQTPLTQGLRIKFY